MVPTELGSVSVMGESGVVGGGDPDEDVGDG